MQLPSSGSHLQGHLLALLTVCIWSTTLVATKLLIEAGLQPIEILFYRFLIGWLGLLIIKPTFSWPFNRQDWRRERWYMLAGLTGVGIYYMLENSSVVYTTASNAGLLVTLSPLFAALIDRYILKTDRLRRNFLLGIGICLAGVFLVIFNGNFVLALNPLGDSLALSAGLFWAVYSQILGRINRDNPQESVVVRMQKVFFYGLLSLALLMPFFGFQFRFQLLRQPAVLGGLLYLGLVASAFCFVTWNKALAAIGVTKTTLYIYLIPFFTIVTSILVLDERLTWISGCGALLIIAGLVVSEGWLKRRKPAQISAG